MTPDCSQWINHVHAQSVAKVVARGPAGQLSHRSIDDKSSHLLDSSEALDQRLLADDLFSTTIMKFMPCPSPRSPVEGPPVICRTDPWTVSTGFVYGSFFLADGCCGGVGASAWTRSSFVVTRSLVRAVAVFARRPVVRLGRQPASGAPKPRHARGEDLSAAFRLRVGGYGVYLQVHGRERQGHARAERLLGVLSGTS